jgi:hypothetical protein
VVRLPIPELPEDVTPEWLTASLTEAGVLQGGRIVTAPWERVGQEYGFTGLVGRVRLQYERARSDLPSSLIVKLPMAEGETASGHRALQGRDPTLMRRYYERCAREERFYRELGAAFAPRLYYSAADDVGRRVVLLLGDVGGGRQGDVLNGCSIDDAAVVVEELAPFHARWWGDRVPTHGFAPLDLDPRAREERYAGQVERFLERYGEGLPRALGGIVRQLGSRLADVVEALYERRQTLIHADLHLDNVIFGNGRSVVVLDWQTVSVGPPAWDVALFLFGSLSVEDRRAAEAELLDRYVTLLSRHGVRNYSVRELRLDCVRALLVLLAGTIGWLTALDPAELSGRERALHDAALTDGRLVSALLDHDAEATLARAAPA